jgi:diaminopimelate epimerase
VTCKQYITVDDTTDPEITCPDDVVVECIEDVPAPDISLVITHDNCDAAVIVTFVSDVSDGNTCAEVITRTYSATDACGNTVTCKQFITVDDTTDPEITCPDDVVVECIEDVPAPDVSLVITHDNCDAAVIVTFVSDVSDGNTCAEVITRTYSATDACGNTVTCKQFITVDDTTDPEITCPDDVVVECIEDVPAPDISLVITHDNCDAAVIVTFVSDVSDGNTCAEVITRTYSATDACGNTVTCKQ